MTQIGVFEAKARLSELLQRVKGGEHFQITHRGQPIAELGPVRSARKPLVRGCAADSGISMSDDFDAPLDDFADYM